MKSLIISCCITAVIALSTSSVLADTSAIVTETPPIIPSDGSPITSTEQTSPDSTLSTENIDTSSTTATKASSIKPCKLASDFKATNRYVYQCSSGESYNIDAAKLRHCKAGGVAEEDNTVSKNLYSLFCRDGSSTTATCTNGFFTKPHQLMINGTKQIVITCKDNG
ncbi:MAG: hypothetical protein P1U40_11445 [Coxiellaceae bacterium]|nr:hypothetical protein [Coxiellaceae bacterium]